jgi:flagellar biosynthesis protein FlhA
VGISPVYRALNLSLVPLSLLGLAFLVPWRQSLLEGLLVSITAMAVLSLLIALLLENSSAIQRVANSLPSFLLLKLSQGVLLMGTAVLYGDSQGTNGTLSCLGDLVVGESLRFGILLFLILVLMQRSLGSMADRVLSLVHEFWCDTMPGRQMAIDADLVTGAIDLDGATAARKEVQLQVEVLESLGRVGEWVKRDSIVSTLLVVVVLTGGAYVHFIYRTLTWPAWHTLAKTGLGLGILLTLQSLLVATALGLFTSAVAKSSELEGATHHFPRRQDVLKTAGGVTLEVVALAGLGLPPGTSLALQLLCRSVSSVQKETSEAALSNDFGTESRSSETVTTWVSTDPITVEVGRGLLSLIDPREGAKLLAGISPLRQHLAAELGLVLPAVRFRDNLGLKPNTYVILFKDEEVARGEVHLDRYLALGAEAQLSNLVGLRTVEPAFGMMACWVTPEQKNRAEALDCLLFAPIQVILTHLSEMARRRADLLLDQQQLQHLLDGVSKTHSHLVEALQSDSESLLLALRALLAEGVSIGSLVTIFEAFLEARQHSELPTVAAEFARAAVCREICSNYVNSAGKINTLTLAPELEESLRAARTDTGRAGDLNSGWKSDFLGAITFRLEILLEEGLQPVIVTPPDIRLAVREVTKSLHRDLVILSWNEIAPGVKLNRLGEINLVRAHLTPDPA